MDVPTTIWMVIRFDLKIQVSVFKFKLTEYENNICSFITPYAVNVIEFGAIRTYVNLFADKGTHLFCSPIIDMFRLL